MQKWKLALFGLTLAGLSFSGYLSAVKLFTDTCAFNESCPYFWGYPACWYGFVMYLVMFVVVSLSLAGKTLYETMTKTLLVVSSLGIVFSGYFVIQEVIESRAVGVLGFSTCVYGFVFYVAIWIVTRIAMKVGRNV